MGHAEELRDELRSSGCAAVARLIREAASEAEWVDYKRAVEPAVNLSRLVTAFANTAGGIILWGVDAPSPRPDRAEAPADAPCEDAAAFRTRLEGLTSGACDPPVPGIEHFPALLDGGPRGYVVTYVPASTAAPHRDRDHVHRLRVGSSTIVMPAAVFASYFGRRPTPSLSLVVALTQFELFDRATALVVWDFMVRNDGDAPLSDLYFSAIRTGLRHDAGGPPNWEAGAAQGHAIYQGSDATNRPFSFSLFASSSYRVAPRGLAVVGRLTTRHSRTVASLAVEFDGVVGAVGAAPRRWRARLPPPPQTLVEGRHAQNDDPQRREAYCRLLAPECVEGGEFMHHAYWRLARDHGSTNPSR